MHSYFEIPDGVGMIKDGYKKAAKSIAKLINGGNE